MNGASGDVLLPAVLAASVVGSVHCAGMCGPLMAFVVGGDVGARRSRTHVVYHVARGVGYAALGLAAGLAGSLVELTTPLTNFSSVAAIVAAATLVLSGVLVLAAQLGWRARASCVPGPVQRLARAVRLRAMQLGGTTRAAAMGAVTGLLPCGWLYAFVALAAGTGSPTSGVLVMLAFWAGTIPALAAVGLGVDGLRHVIGPRLRMALCTCLIGVGAFALIGRADLNVARIVAETSAHTLDDLPAAGEAMPCCDAPEARDGRDR